jgi:hypothetical protein
MKNLFKSSVALFLTGAFLMQTPANAQEEKKEEKKLDLTVTLNSDVFFGFYPFFTGAYPINDKLNFTFYGILWSGGTGQAWGNWTEVGAGVGFNLGESVYVSPQIGLLNGSLTSGLGTPVLGEGVVPNLTIALDNSKSLGEFYLGYYHGINHGNPNTNNYLHYWLNYGYKINSFLSTGLHYEHLRFTGGMNYADDAAYDYYQAVGPFVQFSDPNGGSFVRFSGGADLRSEEQIAKSNHKQHTFYKLTVGFKF